MVRIREHRHKRPTCHKVATVVVCADLAADIIVKTTMILAVDQTKEAAP